MLRSLLPVVACVLISGALATASDAAVSTERVASGLNRPVYVTAPAGDTERLFIVEQRGVIKILKNGTVLATPFLDIDALVPNISGNDERGLLGLAFAPDYDTSREFYVKYTNLSSDTVIARYLVSMTDPDVAETTGEIILTIDQPASNHNGGHIAFGPNDGMLYIGMGDGGSSNDPWNNAQSDDVLLGKMLRIDVQCGSPTYCIPADNPHVGPGDPLDEIWAKGLRNPYRFSFDRSTGDMYIGDVGQFAIEEVDVQPAASTGGENYGWKVMEGNSCVSPSTPPGCNHSSFTPPVHTYSHSGGHCSITGGYVYRGAINEIQGDYFFADFCSRQIWSFKYDVATGTLSDLTNRTTELDPPDGFISTIAGFGEDGVGELYIVDRDSGTSGEVFKIIGESTGVENPEPAPRLPLALSAAQPNPFRPLAGSAEFQVDLGAEAELSVAIYTSAGRLVRTLHQGSAADSSTVFAWDGRDDRGGVVSSGVYFVRAEIPGHRVTTRVALIR